MHGRLIPSKSGVHRHACLALYRALLRQTSVLPPGNQLREKYTKQVKVRTRQNARIQGHWAIHTALRAGYETLDAIRSMTRLPKVLQYLNSLPALRPKPVRAKPSPPPPTPTQSPRLTPMGTPYLPVLSRPYPNISGRRHVPVLVDANRVPMLRIKKPQSPRLSGIIQHIVRKRHRQMKQMKAMEDLIPLAADEDEWDKLLEREHGVGIGSGSRGASNGYEEDEAGTSYETEPRAALHSLQFNFWDRQNRSRLIARRMTWIVDEERRLATEEDAREQRRRPSRDVAGHDGGERAEQQRRRRRPKMEAAGDHDGDGGVPGGQTGWEEVEQYLREQDTAAVAAKEG